MYFGDVDEMPEEVWRLTRLFSASMAMDYDQYGQAAWCMEPAAAGLTLPNRVSVPKKYLAGAGAGDVEELPEEAFFSKDGDRLGSGLLELLSDTSAVAHIRTRPQIIHNR